MFTPFTSNKELHKVIINAIGFQIGWWVCILGTLELAVGYTLLYLIVHAKWLLDGKVWQHIVRIAVIGCAIDSFLAFSGVLDMGSERAVIPLWLVCIWGMFAPCFFLSLKFLSERPLVASVFGAIGGPLAYFGGAALTQDINIGEPVWQSILILAVVWAALVPLVFAYVKKDGVLVAKGH